MILKVYTPGGKVLEDETLKIKAEAVNGCFTILPRHTDFIANLVPGILYYTDKSGTEKYVAVDEGIFLKTEMIVKVAVRNAIPGTELGKLQDTVKEYFFGMSEQERKTRSILAGLETDFVKKLVDLHER